ncbi:MAG TPA: class II fructose-bisphosphate aldolase [Candidatus Paceibacterota bacterium]
MFEIKLAGLNNKQVHVQTYREILEEARKGGRAVGHFNFANFEMMWGVVHAAQKLGVPVLLGLAEGEQDWVGLRQAVALIKSLREDGHTVFLNADHTYSFERVRAAIDAGFDSVIFDGAKLPMEENIKITKQCVDYARASGRDVIVEAELGYIGEGSTVRDTLPEGIQMTSVEDAVRFVKETGVDLFAPAVGNIHGMLKPPPGGEPWGTWATDPPLDIARIKEIATAVSVPLVLHGGSGTPNLADGIKAGITEVHISTELRKAWHDAMSEHFTKSPGDLAPYKVGKEAREAVEEVASDRLKLFTNP